MTYPDMPYGYRWIVAEDFDLSEYAQRQMRPFAGGTIIPWDCMIEFGMDHDHDPVVCESIMAGMSPESVVHEHYNEYGIKEYY